VASNRNVVDSDFGPSTGVIKDNSGACKILSERINHESRLKMQAHNVPKQRSAGKKNLSVLPIPDRKDNVFFINSSQRAILHRIVKLTH